MLLKIKANKRIIILTATFLGLSCFYLFNTNNVLATNWTPPSSNPPTGNIPRPLNVSTGFSGGLVAGSSYDQVGNRIIFNFKSCEDGQAFIYDNNSWDCGDIQTDDPTLLSVLNAGSDASSFIGGVTIGDVEGEEGFLNVGGPLTVNWFHATSTSGVSRINHDLEIFGFLSVFNNAYLEGDLEVAKDLEVGGFLSVENGAEINNYLDVLGPVSADWINAMSDNGLSYFNHSLAVLIDSNLNHDDVEKFSFYINNTNSGPIIALQGDVNGRYQGISVRSGINNEEWFVGSNDSNDFVVRRDNIDYLKIDKSNGDVVADKKVIAEDFCLEDGKCFSFGKKFLGLTTNTFSGNVGGYNEANQKCKTNYNDEDAYVCTIEDILYFINKKIMPTNINNVAWINGGPPGFIANANDCGGWKKTNDFLGRVWVFNESYGTMTTCISELRFACCK